MTLDDIVTLAQAAEELGIAASTLRHQAQVGRLEAKVLGKTWITTRQEVERYRHAVLGQVGRPPQTIRRTNETSGWSATYNVDQVLAADRGRMLDVRGIVAHAVDNSNSGAEILTRLYVEGPLNGLLFNLTKMDEDARTLTLQVHDRRRRSDVLDDDARVSGQPQAIAQPTREPGH